MNKNQLKSIVKEEYQNVKSFMEDKYGFTPELGKVISNPYTNSFVNEAKEPEVITQLRKIVKDKQNNSIKDIKSGKKVRVDMNSANLMVQVYDALKKQSNKDKFVKSGIVMMGHMAYKLMKKESVNEAFVVAYGKGPKPIKPAFAAYADKKMAQKFMADMKKDGYKVMMTQKKIRGVDESVNEASKEAMGIAGFTGTRGVAVDDFIKKNKIDARKLFNFVRKGNLRDRMDFVTAIAGKPNNKFFKMIVGRFAESVNENKYRMMKRSSATKMLNKKLTIKRIGSRERFKDTKSGKLVKLNGFAFHIPGKGYIGMKDGKGMPYTPLGGKNALQDILDDGGFLDYKPNIFINPVDESVNEDKNQIVQLKKKVGKSEIKFYDALSKIEKKLGKKKYRAFLEKGLTDFKINAKHYDYRSNGDAEEKLFNLAK